MAKFKVAGLLLNYLEPVELEAESKLEAEHDYYQMFKEGKVKVIVEDWEIAESKELE
jgi:hypothetical protein